MLLPDDHQERAELLRVLLPIERQIADADYPVTTIVIDPLGVHDADRDEFLYIVASYAFDGLAMMLWAAGLLGWAVLIYGFFGGRF